MTTRKLREQVQPPEYLEDYVMRLFYPQRALGKYVDEEMSESMWTLIYLVSSMCTVFILGLLLFDRVGSGHKSVSTLASAGMVISIVIFVSFIYTIFDATKMFHLSLLVALVTIMGLLLKEMDDYVPEEDESNITRVDKDMVIAILVLGSVTLTILLYYWLLSRTVTDATEYREKERRVRLDNKYKDKIERVRRDYDQLIKEHREERTILQDELREQMQRANVLERKLEKITSTATN